MGELRKLTSSPSTKRFIKNPDSIHQDSNPTNVFTHVWTAPRVKGLLEALRSFRVRTCLRPVGAEKIAPLALMRICLVLRPISLTRSYRRRVKTGLRNLSVRSHHPLVTLGAFSLCSETSFCQALLAQVTTGRSS
jgi:hypothetical protein